jgi:acyl-CoA reductase-like NAD-dependent aldehyde dehydrogenase
MIKVFNPSTEKLVAEHAVDSAADIESKFREAAGAFDGWRQTKISERCARLKALGNILRDRRGDLAVLMAKEMGKSLKEGEPEISKCAVACDHFAQNSQKLLEDEQLASGGGRGFCRFDPLGPILAIMPWNFPFWQVIRAAVPALAAGNVMILKHAPNVPGCAQALAEIFADARFPDGVFSSILVEDNAVAQKLCAHPLLAGVTITGSERAGMAVAATACGALKKVVLELGGSDPFIVLKDADVEFAATSAAESRCINSGQSCICAKRFIVEEPVLRRFTDAFVAAMDKRKVGDPLDRTVDMGPLARRDLLETLQKQVDDSIAEGASLLTGGNRIGTVGNFYPPTVLADARPGMPIFDEETFGPVAALTAAIDSTEAIKLANQTRFGLGASIWTRDLVAAEELAGELDTGNVFVNSVVRSDPRLPFGGIKNSGWGRELAEAGLKEFTNVKTVWISKA